MRTLNLPLSLWGYRVQCFGDVALSCGQGVDITIPVTCSVFEPEPMTSQCTRGVPRLKFGHKIHEMWVFFSFVAIASQKLYRRVAKHHCCFISHGATPGADDVTGQSDLAGWPYLYYRALSCGNIGDINTWKVSWHFFVLRNFNSTFSARNSQNKPSKLNLVLLYIGPVPAPSTGLGWGRFSSTGRSSASTEIGWPSTNLHWWRKISTARRAG